MVSRAVAHFGHVDILINNAGATVRKPPEDITAAEWDNVLDVNLRAAFLSCKAVYPHFRAQGGGKIISIGSMYSIFGGGGSGVPYSSSKGGIVQLSKSFAVAWAGDNIQSNAILPGWFMTELTQAIPETQPERYDLINRRIPAGRWGEASELQGAAVFPGQPRIGLRNRRHDCGGWGVFSVVGRTKDKQDTLLRQGFVGEDMR